MLHYPDLSATHAKNPDTFSGLSDSADTHETNIEPGNQKIGCDHIYGKSITDPCLGWEESERLLYTIAEMC